MAKIKLPIVTINAKGGAQYVVEGVEAVNALTQLENYPERGIRIKVDGKMTVITEGCLCSAAVTGEVEVDVPEIVCAEVECEPISNILPNPKNPTDPGENSKPEEKAGEK
ncbi:hypothetical protein HRE94_00305 [Enterococcus faecalis]|uniref:hypothetical protein n=1 Tax=Enterococcus faecalis TaxID=1351 RepID=UPI00032ED171|nr:hypothetical protein [Enterococcus faecalis]EHG5940377.1 hypothetical protein [Enterococcus faecalis]EJZ8623823.1 hypothetical protein [Enterococcus faecalis]EKL7633416.1 hypothetical protein [Enterococcus faecalis]EKQ3610274.1 hypothetical protein [Enterococcus faecalis]EMC0728782.1 hypothetical protein [Enterococcus faecalis]